MIINDALRYLGQNANKKPSLRSYFKELSIDVERALEVEEGFDNDGIYKDEGELYLEKKNEGFCFLLKTENILFESKKKLPLMEGDYYFTTIFLYADGKDGYSKYEGELPHGFLISDTFDVITKKIGSTPNFVNEHIKRWDNLDGMRLSLSSIVDNRPNIIIISKV